MSECFAGIDAGGTTFKCGILSAEGDWIAKHRVNVSDPSTTIADCLAFFESHSSNHDVKAMGIASFGPIDVDPTSDNYGTLLDTPKPGWSGTPLRRRFQDAMKVPVFLDTDVNGALLAEMNDGAAKGAKSAAYITIGTGIGAGIAIDGNLVGKRSHPEFGHIPLPRHPDDRDYLGACPFHGDCLEGLASVTALKDRWGDPIDWSPDHTGWEVAAHYIGSACATLILTMRLEKIVLGGGLMLAEPMLNLVRAATHRRIGDYIETDLDAQVVRPVHGDDAGLMGAIYLARLRDQG